MDPSWLNNMLLAAALTAGLYGSWRLLSGAGSAPPDGRLTRTVADQALLLDVRTPAEFAVNGLPGARNIPVRELSRRIHELG